MSERGYEPAATGVNRLGSASFDRAVHRLECGDITDTGTTQNACRRAFTAMDIGDIVIYGGKRFSVRGFDPVGVEPRFIYLQGAETGEAISVPFAELPETTPTGAVLRLVDAKETEAGGLN